MGQRLGRIAFTGRRRGLPIGDPAARGDGVRPNCATPGVIVSIISGVKKMYHIPKSHSGICPTNRKRDGWTIAMTAMLATGEGAPVGEQIGKKVRLLCDRKLTGRINCHFVLWDRAAGGVGTGVAGCGSKRRYMRRLAHTAKAVRPTNDCEN